MNIMTIRTYADSLEANMALNRLQANEIPCFLQGERSNDTMWHISVGLGGIKLMVHEDDVVHAEAILNNDVAEVELHDEPDGAVCCPVCGSKNVRYGVRTKSRIGWVGLLFSLLIAAPAPVPNQGYHCFSCRHEFR